MLSLPACDQTCRGPIRATLALLDKTEGHEPRVRQMRTKTSIPQQRVVEETMSPELAAVVSRQIVGLVVNRVARKRKRTDSV